MTFLLGGFRFLFLLLFFILILGNDFVLAQEKNSEEIACWNRFNEKIKKYEPPKTCVSDCDKIENYLSALRDFLVDGENRPNKEASKLGCVEEMKDVSLRLLSAREIYRQKGCQKTACKPRFLVYSELNDYPALLAQARRGTFQISSSGGTGSTFFIGRSGDYCVFGTNAHVVSEKGKLFKDLAIDFNYSGKISKDEIVDEDNFCINKDFRKSGEPDGANNDLALIKVKCDTDGFFSDNLCPLQLVKWEKSSIATYVDVPSSCRHGMIAEGFPKGSYKFKNSCSCMKGKCFANQTFFDINSDILPKGSSGGPVFNSSGELCGMITQGVPDRDAPTSQQFSKTTKSQAILDLMDTCGGDFKVKS